MIPAITLHEVSKYYPVFSKPSDAFSYLCGAILRKKAVIPKGRAYVRALDDISININTRERVGIIGRNGAGKSTLLKMLSGGTEITSGEITVNGEIYSLMPGTVSFSPDLSGFENARNHLRSHSLTGEVVNSRLKDIEVFTELGEYFHQPVSSYSLGMRVRTEFAVATAVHADIILIDEVLGAGDIYWTEKINARMDALCEQGCTLILVSHSLDQIMRFCKRAIWIESGRVVMDDSVIDVIKRYEGFLEHLSWKTNDVDDKSIDASSIITEIGDQLLQDSGQKIIRWPGHKEIIISGIWINGKTDTMVQLSRHDAIRIDVRLLANKCKNYNLRLVITIWLSNGKRGAVIENENHRISLKKKEIIDLSATFDTSVLCEGNYDITISVFDMKDEKSVDERNDRQDVIYKSVKLNIFSENNMCEPLFYLKSK